LDAMLRPGMQAGERAEPKGHLEPFLFAGVAQAQALRRQFLFRVSYRRLFVVGGFLPDVLPLPWAKADEVAAAGLAAPAVGAKEDLH
jgi:hypothetical protein